VFPGNHVPTHRMRDHSPSGCVCRAYACFSDESSSTNSDGRFAASNHWPTAGTSSCRYTSHFARCAVGRFMSAIQVASAFARPTCVKSASSFRRNKSTRRVLSGNVVSIQSEFQPPPSCPGSARVRASVLDRLWHQSALPKSRYERRAEMSAREKRSPSPTLT
jgi:hypothetical protein